MIPRHICSMCIKTKVGKQEVGIWQAQKRFPQYSIPIWSLWSNIRFLPSIVADKNATKNILGRTEGQTDRRTEVKQYLPPRWSGGIITKLDVYVFTSHLDSVSQTLLKFKCQLKLNWDLNLLEMYINLHLRFNWDLNFIDVCATQSRYTICISCCKEVHRALIVWAVIQLQGTMYLNVF